MPSYFRAARSADDKPQRHLVLGFFFQHRTWTQTCQLQLDEIAHLAKTGRPVFLSGAGGDDAGLVAAFSVLLQ
jgi:hypothetical protein